MCQDDVDAELVRGFDDKQIAGSCSSQFTASSVYMTQLAAGPSSNGSATISSFSSIQPPNVNANDQLSSLSSMPMHAGAGSSSASETRSCCSCVSSMSMPNIQSSSSLAGSNNTSDWDSSSAASLSESEMRNAPTASSSAGCSSSSTYTAAAAAAARSLSPVASTSATFYHATASHFPNSSSSAIYAGDDAAVIGDCDDNIIWETWSPPKSYGRQHMSAGSQHAIVASGEQRRRKTSADAAAETSVKTLSGVLKSEKQPANMTAVKEWKGELFAVS